MSQIVKTLSKNDTGETGGHQAGLYIPRPFFKYLPRIDLSKDLDSYPISIQDMDGEIFTWSVRWYKSKGEIHFTGCSAFYVKWNVTAGNILTLTPLSETSYYAHLTRETENVKVATGDTMALKEESQEEIEAIKKKYVHRGFSADPAYRFAVESYSMTQAIEHYSRDGDVEDTSSNHPFDLRVVNEKGEFTVEVKGTASDGSIVILTKNEVFHNRETHPNTELFIFKDIEVKRKSSEIVCSGGSSKIIKPWRPDDAHLEALQFRYSVP